MDLKAAVLQGMHWIHLAGNRSQRQVSVDSVMSLLSTKKNMGNFSVAEQLLLASQQNPC